MWTSRTLSLGGVAQAGDYYGPFETEEECESARVLFDYSDPCGYYLGRGTSPSSAGTPASSC